MSLRSEPIPVVPEETVRVARAAFPKGNLYLKMRDELGTFYEDADPRPVVLKTRTACLFSLAIGFNLREFPICLQWGFLFSPVRA
jgi:transposase